MPVLCYKKNLNKKTLKISGKSTVKKAFTPLYSCSFFMSTPHLLTSHLPQAVPQVLTEWSLGPGETKMAPDNDVFSFNFKSNRNAQGFCKNAAWSFSSVVY